MRELDQLLSSPLGSLFRIPMRECSVSGQLVHQLLCRQLCTSRPEELWFVFGGQPLRFSSVEFEEVTGLPCTGEASSSLLDSSRAYDHGSPPYWYKLIGGAIGATTIEALVNRLKTEKNMPAWKKFKLCLVVIVEGELLCSLQPVKPSVGVVEFVKDVKAFLAYPWGRESFVNTISMVKALPRGGGGNPVAAKLKKGSVAVHGFPLALQLWAFKKISLPSQFVTSWFGSQTLISATLTCLPPLKTFHCSNILAVEYDASLVVCTPSIISGPRLDGHLDDPAVVHLEACIVYKKRFRHCMWEDGDSSLPRLQLPPGVSEGALSEDSLTSADEHQPTRGKQADEAIGEENNANVRAMLDARLKELEASLLGKVKRMVMESPKRRTHKCSKRQKREVASIRSENVVSAAVRVTRSGCAGISSSTKSHHSSMQPTDSSRVGASKVMGTPVQRLSREKGNGKEKAILTTVCGSEDEVIGVGGGEEATSALAGNFCESKAVAVRKGKSVISRKGAVSKSGEVQADGVDAQAMVSGGCSKSRELVLGLAVKKWLVQEGAANDHDFGKSLHPVVEISSSEGFLARNRAKSEANVGEVMEDRPVGVHRSGKEPKNSKSRTRAAGSLSECTVVVGAVPVRLVPDRFNGDCKMQL